MKNNELISVVVPLYNEEVSIKTLYSELINSINDFNFEISNYPNLDGNIPRGGSYGVYISQLVRFCDINQSVNAFINDVKCMTAKFLNQGFERQRLIDVYALFSTKYWFKWSKYGVDITSFCSNIFV